MEKPSGMSDTCTSIADEVIFGEEISKLGKVFFQSMSKQTHNGKNIPISCHRHPTTVLS